MKIRRRPPNPSITVANLEYAIPHEEGKPRNILEKIIWEKDREVEIARQRVSLENLQTQIADLPKPKGFLNALKNASKKPAVIAEVKKASPSRGVIREDFNPAQIALEYVEGGATCLSVLTDKTFFQGGFNVLAEVRNTVQLPLLCKDFILHPYQIYQARVEGADAILLIASILSDQDLVYLNKIALSIGLSVLVEIHDAKELKRILQMNLFLLIGVNNRNLKTFETDITTTQKVVKECSYLLKEQNVLLVSESGLFTRDDLTMVASFGAGAVLVGESLMRTDNIKLALKQLLGEVT